MWAIVGAGSNLGARADILEAARRVLDAHGVRTERRSHTYTSPAMVPPGRPPGPAFLNEAWRVRTTLSPRRLLALLLRVEAMFGRVRTQRWGNRTLDLDVLWAEHEVQLPALTVPHPGIYNRAFAIAPVLDVEPSLRCLAKGMRRRPQRISRNSLCPERTGEPAATVSAVLNAVLSEPVAAQKVVVLRAPLEGLGAAIEAERMRIARVAVLESPEDPSRSAWGVALAGMAGTPRRQVRLNTRVVSDSPIQLWASAS